MLKGIDPLLYPELLKVLAEMGHDDALVLADANFTAERLGAGKPVLRLPGISMARAVQAINSVLALAADVPHPLAYMQVSDSPAGYRSALQREVLDALEAELLPGQSAEALERFVFYERTQAAYAILVTGETQPFGNFIWRKGAVADNLRP